MIKFYFSALFLSINIFVSSQSESDRIEEIYDTVDVSAEYAGGTSSMMNYLSTNITYPQRAVQSDIQGRVFVKFIVSKKGKVTNVSILKGIENCQECNEEAMRVVREMPDFKPAQVNGKNVNSYYILPITFRLD